MDADDLRRQARPGRLRWVPMLALWGVLAAELILLLVLNGGELMYTLDDPYIHLAFAEHLLDGHFGLNAGEVSSPSSSILWPFLLAPFTRLTLVQWVPLLLNVVFASLTLRLVQTCLASVLAGIRYDERLTCLLSVLAIPALNLVGLVFTGMEHSLQVLCAVGLVASLIEAVRTGRSGPWLVVLIVLGPLVRYESAALSAAALVWLWWNGERGRAVVCATILTLLMGGYSLILDSLGLPLLPTSVMAKSASMSPEGGAKTMVYALYHNLESTPGVLMSLLTIALGSTACLGSRPIRERRLAWVMAGGLFLHLLVGRFGWYSRYELYAWSAGLLTGIYLWRDPLRALLERQSLLKTVVVGLLVVGIGCREYVIVLANNALASNNVYQQHYQMHRFAVEFLEEPVAVNDLGWVAFQNDNYVLDLWGLGSLAALEARRGAPDTGWITPLAQEHQVRTAMIYDDWYGELPTSWRRIGELRLSGPRVTAAHNVVAFYAMNPEWEEELTARLRAFQGTLPGEAEFVLTVTNLDGL